MINTTGDLVVLDGKINSDDNALFRQAELEAMRDIARKIDRRLQAAKYDLNYVTLDGNIACMVNGAGLAMATMDVINSTAVSRRTSSTSAAAPPTRARHRGVQADSRHDKVKAILVNIFGGIVRCDMIAEGIIAAVKEVASMCR